MLISTKVVNWLLTKFLSRIYSYPSRSTPEGRLAIVTCRGAGCGGRGSVGAEEGGRGPRGRRSAGPGLGVYGAADRSADDDAVRCGPGRRCAPSASPLRAGPSRVVLTPVAGVKGRSACTPTGRRRQKVRTFASAPLSPDGDEPKRINRHRGEHEASRKPHRVRNAGRPVLS